MYPDIAPRGYFTFDANKSFYCANTVYFIVTEEKYLLGILNSHLISFYYSKKSALLRGGFLRFFSQDVVKIPIRTIDFSDPADTARHDNIVALAGRMLDLNKQRADVKTAHEKNLIERQIEGTDKQIDALVYELYGLTGEEIRIVEGKE